ncbi:hypothetical protein L2E82_38656 [Cichorium intybus]|uniref:Uncharacterized protein n=1 Tax=Cichorium intybus TaxID=13427 RepID=A0ACB9AGB3_CICIN|nr:hypothetical protein L2E82_38656 [Cichorium intybus]
MKVPQVKYPIFKANKYRIKFFGGLQIPNPPLFKPENSTQDIVSERNKKDYFRFCSRGRLRKSCCSIPIPNPTQP